MSVHPKQRKPIELHSSYWDVGKLPGLKKVIIIKKPVKTGNFTFMPGVM